MREMAIPFSTTSVRKSSEVAFVFEAPNAFPGRKSWFLMARAAGACFSLALQLLLQAYDPLGHLRFVNTKFLVLSPFLKNAKRSCVANDTASMSIKERYEVQPPRGGMFTLRVRMPGNFRIWRLTVEGRAMVLGGW